MDGKDSKKTFSFPSSKSLHVITFELHPSSLQINKKMDGSESPKNTQEMSSFRAKVWPNVKPFVNGFLTGQMLWLQVSCLQKLANGRLKGIPFSSLFEAAYTTAQFGTFDFLRKWIKDGNGGIPLTLQQETCCGMISGGIAGCISYPLRLAQHPVNPNSSMRSLVHPLYLQARKDGFLALWKGSGHHVTSHAFMNMGLLTSYTRSLSYFRDSAGLSNTASQIGAGMVSAFGAAACGSTYDYISKIDELILKSYGDLSYSTRLRLFVETLGSGLRPGGEVMFYTGVLRNAIMLTPLAVVSWLNLESINKFEESRGY